MTRQFIQFGLIPGVIIRLGMIIYSIYHDKNSVLKYTDIDYQVFSDASKSILSPPSQTTLNDGNPSWIGSPYDRATYRYTPLLAIILTPNHFIHPCWGKALFATSDLLIGILLNQMCPSQTDPVYHARMVSLIWLLNPFVINISTRGSSEALLGLIIIGFLHSAKSSKWDQAAILLGLAVHLKIYPFIYGVAVLAYLRTNYQNNHSNSLTRWFHLINYQQIRFTFISLFTFSSLNFIMYSIWGYPFIESSYLYHLHRLDHRHNFSPYFYPIYLRFTQPTIDKSDDPNQFISTNDLLRFLQYPLSSFIPQISLTLTSCFYYGKRDLTFACFISTYSFVIFNKVSTSQYFIWYLWFIPLLIQKIRFNLFELLTILFVWISTQLIWLSNAYKLEFLGQPVFRRIWLSSILFFLGNAWIIGFLIIGFSRSSTIKFSKIQ